MTYAATLEYLYTQLPMFQRIGDAAFKKDLTNTLWLCELLGQPQNNYPSIHIAGTNGKGSTAHLLSAVMQAQGRKVGVYTSPHYRDFRERIKIGRDYITEQEVTDFVVRYREKFEEIQPSFFEITVAMAFDHFARHAVEVAIIETGLGGRLDSTNVITPILSIITNISFDHQQFLGDTLPLIAGEKAGIIKANVPVVIGETHPETAPVFIEKAAAMNAPITFADAVYRAETYETSILTPAKHDIFSLAANENLEKIHLPNLTVGLVGAYQAKNIVTVLAAIDRLNDLGWAISEAQIRLAFAQVVALSGIMGRWQLVRERPLTLVDSAHNEGGIKFLVEELAKIPHARLHFVVGMVRDKDQNKVLQLLPKTATYYFCAPDIPRKLPAENLQSLAAAHSLSGKAYASVAEALAAATEAAADEDLVFVGGSIFVVAEVI
jgi:dihydrofolate synthase / folylpolyglutamate synthase